MSYTPTQEKDWLDFDPFEGDRDDPSQRLGDAVVKARKDYPNCWCCYGPIEKGTRHRAIRERNPEGGKGVPVFLTFRICPECCDAHALFSFGLEDGEDESEDFDREAPLFARMQLGEDRRKAEQKETSQ